jgi:hypothetical protein
MKNLLLLITLLTFYSCMTTDCIRTDATFVAFMDEPRFDVGDGLQHPVAILVRKQDNTYIKVTNFTREINMGDDLSILLQPLKLTKSFPVYKTCQSE